MALNLSVLQQPLHSIDVPDPLVRRAKVAQLADIEAQAQQRQSAASKDQLAVERAAALEQALSGATWDAESGMPDKSTMQKIFKIDPSLHSALTDHYTSAATAVQREKREGEKTRSDLDTAIVTRDKTVWEIQKEKQERTRKQAEESAGILVPGTEFTTDKQERAAQYRVRQPDGSYVNEVRVLGKQGAPPQNPPQPTAPLSPERFKQEQALRESSRTMPAEPGSYMPLMDNQGRVIGAWNPKSGEFKPTPEAAAGSRRSPLPQSANTKIADFENAKRKIDDLATAYRPEFVGPAQGRYEKSKSSGILSFLPMLKTPEGYGEFSALNADIKNSVIKLVTGAQMGVQEAQRILQQVPVETDKDEIWMSKYEQTKKNAEFLLERIRELTGGGGGETAADPLGIR